MGLAILVPLPAGCKYSSVAGMGRNSTGRGFFPNFRGPLSGAAAVRSAPAGSTYISQRTRQQLNYRAPNWQLASTGIRIESRFAMGTGHLCQIKFWLMQVSAYSRPTVLRHGPFHLHGEGALHIIRVIAGIKGDRSLKRNDIRPPHLNLTNVGESAFTA